MKLSHRIDLQSVRHLINHMALNIYFAFLWEGGGLLLGGGGGGGGESQVPPMKPWPLPSDEFFTEVHFHGFNRI